VATTRECDRIAATLGLLSAAQLSFDHAQDIPNGGTLCALPALLAFGLLKHQREVGFTLPAGFYPMDSIFILLAIMALARVPSIEQLRYQPPGEWGKLLGLDRIPEVRTLRNKIGLLADHDHRPARWASLLAKDWLEQHDQAIIGTLLIDGHTRVYHGDAAQLPKRYISRERLCLRATTDYWVNALDGAPLFCVTKPIDDGLQQTLEHDIVPRLLLEVPGQPSPERLEQEPLLHRFTIVFDREGYSPSLFARLKAQRIAILSYHKHPQGQWSDEEFHSYDVRMINGEQAQLRLAERGAYLSSGKVWVREIRRLDERGHQTSILSTDYQRELWSIAAAMLARWHQENFFKYMRQHYGLDKLVEHGTEALPDTTKTVNPAWRSVEAQVRSQVGKLNRARAEFAQHSLKAEQNTPERASAYETKKGALLERVTQLESEVEALKTQRKSLRRHITVSELPEGQRIEALAAGRKQFSDSIKLIAYRAETSLVALARERLQRTDDARSFVRGLMRTPVNLQPNEATGQLIVELHGQTNPIHDRVVEHVIAELNDTQTVYPGTELTLVYRTVRSPTFLPGQDV
jgi:hypothetical protein